VSGGTGASSIGVISWPLASSRGSSGCFSSTGFVGILVLPNAHLQRARHRNDHMALKLVMEAIGATVVADHLPASPIP
jgi:hypothetical protein